MERNKLHLSMFGLAMLNVAAVMSLRGLPLIADTGLTMLFYLFFASVLFLIPCALVAAELATGWEGEGGVYRWVKVAFGSRWGFVAIWLQWIQNVVWYPTVLAFASSSFAYLFNKPELASNNYYTAIFIITTYWIATLLTFRGLKVASMLTSLGVILGTVIPGLLIIGMAGLWVFQGDAINFNIQIGHWLPNISSFNHIAFLAGIVLLFAGMEVGAVHVKELDSPSKQYPQAVFLAVIIILAIFSLGALSIATVLPHKEISLTAGIMQALTIMLDKMHIGFFVPIMGLLITFGAVAGVMAWISGPSKGLLVTAKNGEIPPFLAHTNNNGIQTHILVIQGGIVTVLASLYILINNVSEVFFLLSALTVTLYLIMYFLMFTAAIRLRYSHPEIPRAYKIPGGNLGMWLVAGIGTVVVTFAFIIGLFPPAQLQIGTPFTYVMIIVIGIIVFLGLPLIIHANKKSSWLEHPNIKHT